jgi:hypothetical protein
MYSEKVKQSNQGGESVLAYDSGQNGSFVRNKVTIVVSIRLEKKMMKVIEIVKMKSCMSIASLG